MRTKELKNSAGGPQPPRPTRRGQGEAWGEADGKELSELVGSQSFCLMNQGLGQVLPLDSNGQTLSESCRLVLLLPPHWHPLCKQAGPAAWLLCPLSPAAALLLSLRGGGGGVCGRGLFPEYPLQGSGGCRSQTHSGGRKNLLDSREPKATKTLTRTREGGLSKNFNSTAGFTVQSLPLPWG